MSNLSSISTKLKVVISGSSGGVGQTIVDYFLQQGSYVIGIDTQSAILEHENYSFVQADLSDLTEVKAAKTAIEQSSSRIDILINAAGVFLPDIFDEQMESVLQILWKNNVLSATYLTYELYPLLLKGHRPLVVNISSTDAVVASSGQTNEIGVSHDIFYAMTKGALITFTKGLAMKWAKDKIRVNAICPTIIRTPMAEELLAIPNKEQELIQHIPLGRICEPIDVAMAVTSLYNLYMTTGHTLPLDGGYLCL